MAAGVVFAGVKLVSHRFMRVPEHIEPTFDAVGIKVVDIRFRLGCRDTVIGFEKGDGAGPARIGPPVTPSPVGAIGEEVVEGFIELEGAVHHHGVGRNVAVLHVALGRVQDLKVVRCRVVALPFGGRGRSVDGP
jgi:hypothetical protein